MEHPHQFKLKTHLQTSANIIGVGTSLPTEVIKSDDLFDEIKSESQYGIPRDFMSSGMGIIERRACSAASRPSDLAIDAAKKALDAAPHVRLRDIGLVLFCGIERDQPEPATAHTVQHALGINADNVFDVSNACLGFVDGLKIASNYISAGIVKNALVTTGEVSTRVLQSFVRQLKAGVPVAKAHRMIGGLSVGDAGGAVLLGPSEESGFVLFNNYADSAHIEKCIYRIREDGEAEGQMLMAKILAQGIKMHRELIPHTLRLLGWDQFDWIVSHQTGKRNYNAFADFPGVCESRMIKTYEKFGNTATATFALGWESLINSDKVSPGSKVGGLFAGSGLATCQFGFVI